MSEDLGKEIAEVASDKLGVEVSTVKLESRFVEDLGADSLDQVELIMALEDKFDIEIPDEDAEKILTVENAVEYVKNKQ